MHQGKFFYESAMHAIECAINDSPHTYEHVASHLWPSKKLATAYARLKSCLNDEKDEKFSFDEVIEICRFCGCYDPLYHFADECRHDRPRLRSKDDIANELKHDLLQMGKRMEQMFAQLQKVEGEQ